MKNIRKYWLQLSSTNVNPFESSHRYLPATHFCAPINDSSRVLEPRLGVRINSEWTQVCLSRSPPTSEFGLNRSRVSSSTRWVGSESKSFTKVWVRVEMTKNIELSTSLKRELLYVHLYLSGPAWNLEGNAMTIVLVRDRRVIPARKRWNLWSKMALHIFLSWVSECCLGPVVHVALQWLPLRFNLLQGINGLYIHLDWDARALSFGENYNYL